MARSDTVSLSIRMTREQRRTFGVSAALNGISVNRLIVTVAAMYIDATLPDELMLAVRQSFGSEVVWKNFRVAEGTADE